MNSRPDRRISPLSLNKPDFRRALLRWYRRTARDLPWRRTRHPYAVWVAEILLQQTRVNQALPYYESFMTAFPTVRDLAVAKEGAVLKQWEGLGYYNRARHLHRAAHYIVHTLDERFPTTQAEWQRLPGVGRYTAAAIASIAFGERAAVLDGNVKRVLARLFNIEASIDAPKTERALWALAEDLVSTRSPGDFNQAMMELGARMCTPRQPKCTMCPVRRHCGAHALGVQERRPVRRRRKSAPHHQCVVGVLSKKGRHLLARRPSQGLLAGLWEFPGGRVLPGETHAKALRRVFGLIDITIRPGKLLAIVNHAYSHFRVTLNVYRCDHVAGTPKAGPYAAVKWAPRSRFSALTFPKAHHKFLALV